MREIANIVDSSVSLEHVAEKEKRLAPLVVYLIRHGESTSNKNDVSRELTPQGRAQVEEATKKIINQLRVQIAKSASKKGAEEIDEVLKSIKFRVYDSETPRTTEQAQIEKEVLLKNGIAEENIYLLHPNSESEDLDERKRKAGPGIKRRIGTVTESTPVFRKKLDDPDYQKQLGAADGVIAWMIMPEEDIPVGVQSYPQVKESMNQTKKSLQQLAKRISDRGDAPVVVIANSHAPRVTVAMAATFELNPREMSMAGNAEGLRFTFNGQGEVEATLFK